MRKNTLLFNAAGWQSGANYHPSKAGYTNMHVLHLQAAVSLKTTKQNSFCTPTQRQNPMKTLFTKTPLWASLGLKHGKTGISLKTDFLQKFRFIPSSGWATLTLNFLQGTFYPSSAYNDFNVTATIWTLAPIKRRVFYWYSQKIHTVLATCYTHRK